MSEKRALLVIDVQNDFCEGGRLAVPHGSDVVKPINALLRGQKWDLVAASRDWHPRNHVSFASNHKGKQPFDSYVLNNSFETTLWPDHCVANTDGSALVEGLDVSIIDAIVDKGEDPDVEFYSAFRDVFQQHPTKLETLLKEHNITHTVVVGLALDFCVLHTAIDSQKLGFTTSVVLDCCRAISEAGREDALQKLADAGVHVV